MKVLSRLALLVGLLSVGSAQEKIVLTFAGDIMAHDVNYKMANYNHIYDDVRDYLAQDDLSFANLEFPVDDTLPYRTYPTFNVKIPYVLAAIRGGFEAFSLANNHSNDQGKQAMLNTMRTMRAMHRVYGTLSHGLRESPSQNFELAITTLKGIQVGFLAATNLLNSSVGSEMVFYLGGWDRFQYTLDPSKRQEFIEHVRNAARQVDFLVVSLHDGVEYATHPLKFQEDFYYQIRQAGARVVWVQHPHVLNPMQRVGEGVILYSMGNFISGQRHMLTPSQYQDYRAERGDGALVRLVFDRLPSQSWRMRQPQIQFITHFKEEGKGWVVRRLPELLQQMDAKDPWLKYYRYRYEQMRQRLRMLPSRWIWQDMVPIPERLSRWKSLGI